MKKLLALTSFIMLTGPVAGTITINSISNNSLDESQVNNNINENNYVMTSKTIVIEGVSFNGKQEVYSLYLNTNTIANLIVFYNSHTIDQTISEIYTKISLFKNIFNPAQPSDWIQIQQDIAKKMYYTILSCQSSTTGVIVNFGKLTITGFPKQEWSITSINNQ